MSPETSVPTPVSDPRGVRRPRSARGAGVGDARQAVPPLRGRTVDATARRARQAWRTGHALQKIGVEMGDYVSVWIPTGPDVVRAWFGANAVGGVYAPLNLAAQGKLPRAHAQGRRREGARRASPARRAARRDRRAEPGAGRDRRRAAAGRARRGPRSRSMSCWTASPTCGRHWRGRSSRGTTSA